MKADTVQSPTEVRLLKACINDLICIQALPAIWDGGLLSQIVGTLLDVLVGMLRLDFAYAQLNDSIVGAPFETVRLASEQNPAVQPEEIGRHLNAWLRDIPCTLPLLVRNPIGDGDVSIVPMRLGQRDEMGVFVAGCARAAFPTPTEKLVLNIAVNQAAITLHEVRRLREKEQLAQELDQKVAQRTRELVNVNSKLKNEINDRKRVQLELCRKEAYLAEAQKLSRTGSFGWQVSSGEIYWSDETYRIFEFEAATQPTLELALERIHPEDRQLVRQTIDSAVQERKEFDFEHRLLMADGSVKYVRLVCHPSIEIVSDDLEFVGAVTDITASKLAEQTLRQSQAYLAEAQRLSQTGSWAWNLATGDIRYWSEECYRLLGFDPLGPLPTFEEFFQRIHPDDQVAMRERFERAIRERADFILDYRILHPGRGVRDIHAVGHAVLGRSGDLVEFVGTVIDVTERKRAEEELQQLVDFVPQVIVVLGPDGKWIHANRVAQEYTGLTPDDYRSVDLIGRVIHPDDVEKMRAVRECGLSASDPFEIEARLLGKDGVYRWFLFRYNPLVKHGTVRRWYGTATEIESRKQEEERVRKENVRLEERTRIAQELHDTLLQSFFSASMQLAIAADSIPSDSPVKPRLDRILQIIERGIEEGRHTILGLRSVDSRTLDLVLALSRVQQELAVQPDTDFRVIVAGRQQPLRPAIRHEIYRIGREALVNAFCHSRAKRVELELDYADTDLHLRVCDNGCGVDPQVLDSGREGHWGLIGMRERATRIGGLLKISSSATAGTEVHLTVPSGVAFES